MRRNLVPRGGRHIRPDGAGGAPSGGQGVHARGRAARRRRRVKGALAGTAAAALLAIGIVGVRLTGAFWGLESPVPEDKVLAGDLDLFPCGWSWAVTNSLDEERVLGESDLEWVDGGESPNQVSDYWALPGDTLTLSYCVAFHLEGDNLDTSMSVKWSPGAPSQGPTTDATYITGATYKVTWLDPDDGGTVFGPNTGFGAFSLGVLEPSGYDPSTPVKKDFKWEVLVTVEFGGTGWGSASLTPVTLPSFEIAADEKRMGGGFLP